MRVTEGQVVFFPDADWDRIQDICESVLGREPRTACIELRLQVQKVLVHMHMNGFEQLIADVEPCNLTRHVRLRIKRPDGSEVFPVPESKRREKPLYW